MTPSEIGNAIRAFRSKTCPACGAFKEIVNDPFCDDCLSLLPGDLLERVTDRETYIEAFAPALEHLRSRKYGDS